MPELLVGRAAQLVKALLPVTCVAVAALSTFGPVSPARADVDMTGRLVRVKKPAKRAGATPLATSANGTYQCADEYSVIANWYYYYAIGNCRPGWDLEVVSYASENSETHEHSYGGFVNGSFSGCGWIDTGFPLEKLNSNTHTACAGGGSSREFKVEESTFMEKVNHGAVDDGNPVINPRPCPEYANYRPWSSSNVEKELIRTAPEYAASAPGSDYPALKWRYVTKYASTDGSGKYVMVRDDRITGAGEGNWVFVPLSCLRGNSSELPENTEERNAPPPTATTGGSSSVASTSAVLAGSINPNGLDTHYYIEWGREASKPYEDFAPGPYPGEDVGSGTGTVNRSVTATGLVPNTIYYYRLIAKSPTGTSEGSTQSFRTFSEPVQAAQNMLANASFLLESPGGAGGLPQDWTAWENGGHMQFNRVVNEEGAEQGPTYEEWNANVTLASLGQDVYNYPQVGQNYTFSVWMRAPNATVKGAIAIYGMKGGEARDESSTPFTIQGLESKGKSKEGWQLVSVPLQVTRTEEEHIRVQVYEETPNTNLDLDGATLE